MTSNMIPNDPPTIHLDDTIPDAPEFGDEVEIFANVSDPENDTIQWANFTIWEYNEDQTTRLIHNENGSVEDDDPYTIWTADNITADLENGTYNWTVTISDPWATQTQTGRFTLEEVSPNASAPAFQLFDPWGIQADTFRPGQTLELTTDIIDLNGRSDLDNYYANISSPNGLEASYLSLTEGEAITNGYTTSRIYDLDDDAEEGTWTVTVWGTDQQGLVGQNSSTFEVMRYDNVTLRHEFDLAGSLETRSGDLQYVMLDGAPFLTGIINYNGHLAQSAEETEDVTLTMTQSLEENQFLLPYTAASINELDEHTDQLSSSLLGGRSFLDYNIASIAYALHDELDVTIELSYFDNEQIYLDGFNGSLARGRHQLMVRNAGTENGATVVEVER